MTKNIKNSTKKKTQQEAINNMQQKFSELDFSNFIYLDNLTPGIIICKEHGERIRSYKDIMRSIFGCDLCSGTGNKAIKNINILLEEFNTLYGIVIMKNYDFSNSIYLNARTEVSFICKNHNLVSVIPNRAKSNRSYSPCKFCNIERRIENQKDTKESFLAKAELIYTGMDYFSKFEYKGSKSKSFIKCLVNPAHPLYPKMPNSYLGGQRCPKCSLGQSSKGQEEVTEYIESLIKEKVISRFKSGNGTEIDIFIPHLNLGIEYNGLYYHSTKRGDHHLLKKLNYCKSINIRLIHLFEDEWLFKKEIVKSRLKNILKLGQSINARDTSVMFISQDILQKFLEEQHIQGSIINSTHRYGLYMKDKLVAVMSFCSNRFDKSNLLIELSRYCSAGNVIGGFSKLLKFFISEHNPYGIVSYSDNRWSNGDVYAKNGFSKINEGFPGYFWCKNQRRHSRHNFQKHKLKAMWPDIYSDNKTEDIMCIEKGYCLVEDCGSSRWELILR